MGFAHVRALIAGAALVLAAQAALAHEIGTTQVRAIFTRDHTYAIELTASRAALERRLRAPFPAALPSLARAAHLRFGTREVVPRVSMNGGDPAVIRFEGMIPRGDGAFTWQYDLAFASYPLQIETEGKPPATQWVEGDAPSAPVPLDASLRRPERLGIVRRYLALGFTHIVPRGLDHILFVLGMLLLSTRIRDVLHQVTAFTLAHSVTLSLTMFGLVSAPARLVEPLIALSIAYVALENLATRELHRGRVAIVFAFGLLHGLGFAGVLRELGLPRSEFVTGLVSFNVGVELGQLAVITAAWLMVLRWSEHRDWYRRRLLVPASVAIALAGLGWTVQRLL